MRRILGVDPNYQLQ